MGSKADLKATRQGSRDTATADLDALDVVFPSGQPTAQLATQRRHAAGQYQSTYHLDLDMDGFLDLVSAQKSWE